ncbi:MAG: hypothetical protein LBU65_00610 [Planctomycetaceae bacterium]|jgi:CRISPR/Cas system-associated exonuclease Cas4 (RecB family)|nr:hypothetical protein [Planctomycetaceae bacterium]
MLSFRFIHAADLHLEGAVSVGTEIPTALESRLLDVAYRTAERVFDTALREAVDFVVLSGNIIDPLQTGPCGMIFLIRQLERLSAAGITVYWAGGETDSPEDMPVGFQLPGNVRLFPSSGVQEYTFVRDNKPLARLIGMSRNRQNPKLQVGELLPDNGLFTIAVANGQVEPETLGSRRIPYWALGGRSRTTFNGNRQKVNLPLTLAEQLQSDNDKQTKQTKSTNNDSFAKDEPVPYIVHYPGAPVGMSPKDTGEFGVTLVEVFQNEEPTLTFISLATLRWLDLTVTAAEEDDIETLLNKIREQIKFHRAPQSDYDLMIRWRIDATNTNAVLLRQIRSRRFSEELLAELRGMYGKEPPIAWSLSLEVVEPNKLPADGNSKTILGDYLRLARHYLQNSSEPIDIDAMISESVREQPIAKRLTLCSKKKRQDEAADKKTATTESVKDKEIIYSQTSYQRRAQVTALREAVRLGSELLVGDKRRDVIEE